MAVIDGGLVDKARRDYELKPIIAETYGAGTTKQNERAAVAVVKKTSSIKNLGAYIQSQKRIL